MSRVLSLLCLALAPLIHAPPAPFLKTRAGIEGQWQGPSRMLIKGNRLTFHPGEPGPYVYELRLYPSARPPAFDLFGVKGGEASALQYRGIYRLEGDTLTLSYNPAVRPTRFGHSRGATFTEVYKRRRP